MTEDPKRKEEKESQEEYSFMKEKIKERPFYKNHRFRRAAETIGFGLLFGVAACGAFYLSAPTVESWLNRKAAEPITIPKDDPEEELQIEQQPLVVTEVTEVTELEISDYKRLYQKMYQVAQEAEKSLATVTFLHSGVDWFNQTYENAGQSSGLVVGNNGVELLILLNDTRIQGADSLQVTFSDGSQAEGALKKQDNNTGLSIVGVSLSALSEETQEQVQVAALGSSVALHEGEAVIAIGSPVGYTDSLMYGMLTFPDGSAHAVDGDYQMLVTDMPASENSSGVLVNLDGRVIGVLDRTYGESISENMLTAYGISDIKAIIEHLSNNQDLVYLGVKGADITETIGEEQKLPVGVYVTEVCLESPAMKAGIQKGDVLVEVNGQEIKNQNQLQDELLKFTEGQRVEVKVMRQQGASAYQEIELEAELSVLE